MTFQKDIVFSCKVTLTSATIESFCNNDVQSLAINNMASQLDSVGKYGNTNYYDVSQFISIIQSTETKSSAYKDNSCTYTASYVRFRYCKIGTVPNPQYVLIDAGEYIASQTITASSLSQSVAILSSAISFIEESTQNSTYFSPSTPNMLPSIPKNALYPFTIYDQ